jgi:hypothetical protein
MSHQTQANHFGHQLHTHRRVGQCVKGPVRPQRVQTRQNLRFPPLFLNPRDKKVNPPLIVAPKLRDGRSPSQNRIETWGKKREANRQHEPWSHSPRTHLAYDQDQRSSDIDQLKLA